MKLAALILLLSAAAHAQNCVDVDAGCITSQLNVGPYDSNIGMWPTSVYVEPSGAFRCYNLTRYIAVCSVGSQGPTGAGGDLHFYTGNHRGLRFADSNEFTAENDGMIVLGSPSFAWAWATSYGFTAKPVTVTCPAQGGSPCVTTAVPQSSSVRFVCQEPAGCEYAPDAGCFTPVTGIPVCASDGQQLCITNVSAFPLTVREAPGFMEVGGGFRGGLNANICLEYQTPGHWVERSRNFP